MKKLIDELASLNSLACIVHDATSPAERIHRARLKAFETGNTKFSRFEAFVLTVMVLRDSRNDTKFSLA